MGLPAKVLYATNTGDDREIFLSEWKPSLENGRWMMPPETPIGLDMWISNVLDLKESEGPVVVRVTKAEEETGLWLVCYNEYFGNEQHLYNFKPKFEKDRPDRIDFEYMNKIETNNPNAWGLHVRSDQEMVAGDGPIPATLKRISSDIAEGLIIEIE